MRTYVEEKDASSTLIALVVWSGSKPKKTRHATTYFLRRAHERERMAQPEDRGLIAILQDAIMSIRRADGESQRRQSELLARRRPIRLLDHWLNQLETLVERDDPIVPEPLIGEITGFLGMLDPHLYRKLTKNGRRESVQVLDVLFEAEEQFLPAPPVPADDVQRRSSSTAAE